VPNSIIHIYGPYVYIYIYICIPTAKGREREREREREMRRERHPLLRGGRGGERKYSHTFTRGEMQLLGSLCETILPPLPLNSLEGEEDQPTKAVESFIKASGSQTPVPDQVLFLSLSL
jgi:hypothetical protein